MSLMAAIKEIYLFFFKQDLKSRRTKIFFLLSLIPVIVILLAKIFEMGNPGGDVTAERVFSRVILVAYMQLLIPVLALLFGSIIVNDEIDQKTLVFLTTSPIPKPSVIIGKFLGYVTLSALMINIGLFLIFVILNVNHPGNLTHGSLILTFMGVGTLALITYMAFFTFLGTLMKKSLILGLLFIFGWENVVQYFPGTTQKFTIVHYIKSMLPYIGGDSSILKILLVRLEPSSTAESITVLLIITLVSLMAAAYVFTHKEYVLSDTV